MAEREAVKLKLSMPANKGKSTGWLLKIPSEIPSTFFCCKAANWRHLGLFSKHYIDIIFCKNKMLTVAISPLGFSSWFILVWLCPRKTKSIQVIDRSLQSRPPIFGDPGYLQLLFLAHLFFNLLKKHVFKRVGFQVSFYIPIGCMGSGSETAFKICLKRI